MNHYKRMVSMTLALLLCTVGSAAAGGHKAPMERWAVRYNGVNNGTDIAYQLLIDPWGDVVVAGITQGVIYDDDLILIKYNSRGVEQWQRRWSGSSYPPNDAVDALTVAPNGDLYLAGQTGGRSANYEYDMLLLKYDRHGVLQWERRYNGPYSEWDSAYGVALDQAGNVFITGLSESRLGDWDYLTLKYDRHGAYQWEARYDGPGHELDTAYQVLVDENGRVYVVGISQDADQMNNLLVIQYDNDGVEQWTMRWAAKGNKASVSFYEAALDPTGFLYVTGSTLGPSVSYDLFLLKFDAAGDLEWDFFYDRGVDHTDKGRAIVLDAAGNAYLAGESWSGQNWDLLTAKVNDAGQLQWVEFYNGPGDWVEYGYDVAVDGDGHVYAIAESDGGTTDLDYALVKYDNDGLFQWDYRYDGPAHGEDVPFAMALDAQANAYLTGFSWEYGSAEDIVTVKVGEGDDDDDDNDNDDTSTEPFVVVTSPTHGDVWNEGDTETIAWNMNNPFGWSIRASLFKGGVYEGRRLCDDLPPAATSCQYTVADDIVSGDDYAVQIYFIGHGVPYQDFSPEFTINSGGGDDDDDDDATPAASIEVTAPGEGDVWQAGATQTIAWNMQNPELWTIRINLFKNDFFTGRTLCDDVPADRTSCQYTVADDLTTGDDYTVQAFFIGHGALFHDFSPAFTINGQPGDDEDYEDAADDDDDNDDDDRAAADDDDDGHCGC